MDLDEEQILDYLHILKSQHKTPSDSFFKHTVYGLRYAYRISGMKEMGVVLPSIERPKKFVRIRHYGILSSSRKKALVPLLQQVLGGPVPNGRPPLKHRRCPYCQIGIMVTVAVFDSRGPPKAWSERLKKSAPGTTLQEA